MKENDQEPIALVGGDVVAVDDFPYLGSVIAGSGRMDVDIDRRVAQASKAFCALSLSGQEFEPGDQEEAVQCMCPLSATLWC